MMMMIGGGARVGLRALSASSALVVVRFSGACSMPVTRHVN